MVSTPQTAVILAAGRGQRYGEAGKLLPKGFIYLGDGPIIALSIQKILAAGIRDIVIVTGHLAEHYQALATHYPGIRLVHNPDYADSGSMYSLACASTVISGDFWLFESDLVYERRALEVLAGQTEGSNILLSGTTHSQDEVYAEAPGGFLKQLSKNRADIAELAGELVGISRIDAVCYQQMLAHARDFFRQSLKMEYEQALVMAAQQHPVACTRIADLAWSEIDTAEHWQRVKDFIYPLIQTREAASP